MSSTNHIPSTSPSENRTSQRVSTELWAVVHVKESESEGWKANTKITTVSRNGAGFNLERECAVGRLVMLVMRLQPELRAYDQDDELYSMVALVQHCSAANIDGETVYHVGVAFVGKDVPDSFKGDPKQNYRISGMKKDGLWSITESDSQFKVRRHPRHWFKIAVTVSVRHRSDKTSVKQEALTINISSGGIAVACSLDAEIGDKVKVACRDLNFYAVAVVRNRNAMNGDTPSLHLEFIGEEFPVEKLLAARSVPRTG